MLIALIILLLGGGNSESWLLPKDFNDRIEEIVLEKSRQSDILDQAEIINETITSYVKEMQKTAKDIAILNQNHTVTEQDVEDVIQKIMNKRRAHQEKVLDARMNLANQLQPQEWEQIFASNNEKRDQ